MTRLINFIYKIYAVILLVGSYPLAHIEDQIRELARAYRNWKPKNAMQSTNKMWLSWWKANVTNKD